MNAPVGEASERDIDGAMARPGPTSTRDLFFTFNRLALQGFGGVLAVAQRELVERKGWLSRDEFVEMLALGQVLPGPNIVNLGLMLGDRFFGLKGAFAAVAGMLAVPLVIVLVLTAAYAEFSRLTVVSGALRGMGAVAAGLIIATAIKLSAGLRGNPMGKAICAGFIAVTALVVGGLRWPLVWVLLGFGATAIVVAWVRLGKAR